MFATKYVKMIEWYRQQMIERSTTLYGPWEFFKNEWSTEDVFEQISVTVRTNKLAMSYRVSNFCDLGAVCIKQLAGFMRFA